MSDIRACITRTKGGIGKWYYKPSDWERIYDKMMELTGNDHEISAGAENWCDFAGVGETYEFREGFIEIEEV